MTLRRVLALCLLCGAAAPTAVAAQHNSIVGTWLLQSIEDTLPDHSVYYWMGQRPMGVLVYDAAGNMAVQFVRDPRPRSGRDVNQASVAELRDAIDGYYAYFGRYRLTARGDSVTHVIEISLRPDESGRVYKRAVQVVGDRLVLGMTMEVNGLPHRRVLVWKRAR
jgi:lipocalin-like protein